MNTSFVRVVRNSNFRSLWLAQIISQISLNMLAFILGLQVYHWTRSNTAVSLMLLTFGLPAVFFGVIAGSIVDYFDKRQILIFCNLSRAFFLIMLFFLSPNLIFLYILAILISTVTQLFIPAEGPSIPLLVHQEHLLWANSLFSISFYLSTILGYIFAGPMVNIFGMKNVYLVIALGMTVATYFTVKLPNLKTKAILEPFRFNFSGLISSIFEGFRYISKHPRIKQSLYLLTFSQSLIATLAVLAPGYADRVLVIDLTDASYLVMGPAAIGLVFGAYLAGQFGEKILKGSLVLMGIFGTGITLVLLSLISRFASFNIIFPAMLFLFLLGVSNSLINVPASTILQAESTNQIRSRMYGLLTSLSGGLSILPVVFSGILADTIGLEKTLMFLGFVVIILSVLYLFQRRKVFKYIS